MMPPTWAAANTTASGCSSSKKAFTAAPSNKSNSRCERPTRFVYPRCIRLFQMAEPTNP